MSRRGRRSGAARGAVERALGVRLSKDALGGSAIHAKSGIVDNVADDEHAMFAQVRRFLSYLPSNIHQRAPRMASEDDPERMEDELVRAVPRDSNAPFDMREILAMIFDLGSVFELSRDYGASQIAALARLDGQPVGVLANDNRVYAGAMTAAAGQKYRRFVEMCDTFHLPIVNFIDQPGFMPWAAIQVHKGFGVATAAHYAQIAGRGGGCCARG